MVRLSTHFLSMFLVDIIYFVCIPYVVWIKCSERLNSSVYLSDVIFILIKIFFYAILLNCPCFIYIIFMALSIFVRLPALLLLQVSFLSFVIKINPTSRSYRKLHIANIKAHLFLVLWHILFPYYQVQFLKKNSGLSDALPFLRYAICCL